MDNGIFGALTVAEFCAAYRISRSTFYAEVKAGRLFARKIGNKTIILKSEAERWALSLPKLGETDTKRAA